MVAIEDPDDARRPADHATDGAPAAPGVERGRWSLLYRGFDPAQEGLREALCTTGNGYFASRGAAPESRADGTHYPGTYVGGIFNRLHGEIAGREVADESIVNVPNWLPLSFRIDRGPWFALERVELLLDCEQELDLHRGLLTRRLRFRDSEGRHTRLIQRRFVSMDHRHLAALETTIGAEDWSGRVEVSSGIDGEVTNAGVERYRELPSRHLTGVEAEAGGGLIELRVRTSQSGIAIAEAVRHTTLRGGEPLEVEREPLREERSVAELLRFELAPGEPVTVRKVVALHTSRDPGISEPAAAARRTLEGAPDFGRLLRAHTLRWDHLWDRVAVEVGSDERTQLILNLHVFHLLQTVSPRSVDLDVGVPARGLHGEAYRGHIFWDELFVLPFLNLHLPELTRSLLAYRTRRLGEARRAAAAAGCEGAMFPWQSGSDGREETPEVHLNPRSGRWIPDRSRRQRHINIAIAYNIWQHYQASGDIEFLCDHGAEALLEIARFWASAAEHDPLRDRYVIRGVMGPDEYHDGYPGAEQGGIDNNAYTNVMAAWLLCRALQMLDELPEVRCREICDRLGIDRPERERWEQLSRRLFVPFHEGRIISQFEGYERLAELDWEAYRERYGDIHRLDRILEAEGDTPNRYKASKQADVLMLFYLLSSEELIELLAGLGYELGPEDIRANVDYYLARTSDGSTLSRMVHSWVLARTEREGSWDLFCAALESDVADVQGGTTAEGIHLGAMAGTVDLVQRGFTGITHRDGVLHFKPRLPREVGSLELTLRYRRHWGIRVRIGDGGLRVTIPPSNAPPITISFRDELTELGPGDSFERELGSQ